jgi:hypothetical protein
MTPRFSWNGVVENVVLIARVAPVVSTKTTSGDMKRLMAAWGFAPG